MSDRNPKLDTQRIKAEIKERLRHPHLPPLSLTMRILLWVVGWSVLLVGVAGLVLPGIQGVLTIIIGVAILSLASETIYRLLRRFFRRWPWAMEKVDKFRAKVHGWLHRE